MRLKQQYQELLRLRKEINQRLKMGTDFQGIRELMLYLAQDKAYFKLKTTENQIIMLERFLNIWIKEKKKLPELGVDTDIFYGVFCLDDVERKYQKVKYCGLRIENKVPEEYCEQAVEWLAEEKISGLAIGKIIVFETEKRDENLLQIARWMKQKKDFLNALLLLQYANEIFPGNEELIQEEADIWICGQQWGRVCALLETIKNPSPRTEEMLKELRQVAANG